MAGATRVVVSMPGAMKERLQTYLATDTARREGHTEMSHVMKIALDSFLTKKGG